ncbi:putative bifunctional diguanylate cyclase/phosphodiesterase [Evansella cellulosilytica]|uniref:Diguanylate cyclase/phosphodiesterase with extracellular sensor n=1 Tax=Evansella cellulosilytica (strain ATCC 21833 / DSM 2522 / FERM P-1141 / JCM 9156 / N-4) TaxID=649639 RepID=E6TUY9_EVAC2|nr:EAL domain-containing protein [Evansella cellulosilytica]ADU28572.1 diguanylate cyclase/phosphodiesterase with extracellular sensor [Evansella cellulosilytica DSM 2522]
MKLKVKTAIVILSSVFTLLVILFISINPIMLSQYKQLELELVEQNNERVKSALNNELNRLKMIVRDYSVWDDTYQYMQDGNEQYINSNWVEDTFNTNNINFVVYISEEGELLYDQGYDAVTDSSVHIEELLDWEELQPFIFEQNSVIILGHEHPIFVASHQIYPSLQNAPANGVLLMGSVIDSTVVEALSATTQLPLELSLSQQYEESTVKLLNDELIQGNYFFPIEGTSLEGNLSFTLDRDVYQSGRRGLIGFFTLYALISLCLTAICIYSLDKFILSRFTTLSDQLKEIQQSRDLNKRIVVSGNDEISSLKRAINHMLYALFQSQTEIQKLALTDELTGLSNRNDFRSRFEVMVKAEAQQRIAILFIDIDLFKRINDALGHYVGDTVIKETSKKLKENIPPDAIVGRWGGDEFIVALPFEEEREVVTLSKQLLLDIARPIVMKGYTFEITSSIGISTAPNDAKEPEDLIRQADIAMYEAKRHGKNQYRFYQDVAKYAYFNHYVSLENDLRYALQNNEFNIYYQPIMNADGNVLGVEALLRWENRDKGMIPPDKFIPVAEELGMMPFIGKWVLKESIRQVKRWHELGYEDISLSVNVSKTQLVSNDFCSIVKTTLEECDFPPELLVLEITESDVAIYMEKLTLASKVLTEMGVKISLDDFGMGASSLHYLKEIFVDQLKIDRSFVNGIPSDSFDSALLSGIVTLCKKLKIEVVAEGIETEEQYIYLKEDNISLQGYYFSKPLPKDEVEMFIIEKNNSIENR